MLRSHLDKIFLRKMHAYDLGGRGGEATRIPADFRRIKGALYDARQVKEA